jgi:type II secretion system protein C
LNIRKVLLTFKLALVLVLFVVIVRTIILPQNPAEIFRPSSATGTRIMGVEGIEDKVGTSVEDYTILVEQNIFGVTDTSNLEETSSKVDDVITLVGEELNLELIGTVCGNTKVSRAIIKNNRNNQLGMYRTGQNVAGARIKGIEENAVILLHNGQRKMLALNRNGVNISQQPSSSGISETGKVSNAAFPDNQPDERLSTKILLIESILNEAAIEPYLVDGQVEGLRISDLDKIPMATSLGLKDGDIICRVNGHRLTGKQQAFQVFKKARSEAAMNLELLDNGQTRELSFTLQ